MNPSKNHPAKWQWMLGILLLAPIQLGAKGCDVGVVGDNGSGGANSGGVSSGGATSFGGSSGGSSAIEPGDTCGGLLGASCGKGEYCNYPIEAMCGAADQTGVCTPFPETCTTQYAPVCGCDDQTYGNVCDAALHGISISRTGTCEDAPDSGDTCGGLLGASCGDGEYCNYPIDAMCGAADQTGVCTPIPEACDLMYSPVCGCDDETYGNACAAASAGVSVVSTGACESTKATNCGGIAGLRCPTGQYCNYPIDAMCGAADQMGTCTNIPDLCTMEYSPVCGCDGKTYGNRCAAAAEGISVSKTGSCS